MIPKNKLKDVLQEILLKNIAFFNHSKLEGKASDLLSSFLKTISSFKKEERISSLFLKRRSENKLKKIYQKLLFLLLDLYESL